MDLELGSPDLQTTSFNMDLEIEQVRDLPSTPRSVCENFHGPMTKVCGMQTGAVPPAFPCAKHLGCHFNLFLSLVAFGKDHWPNEPAFSYKQRPRDGTGC